MRINLFLSLPFCCLAIPAVAHPNADPSQAIRKAYGRLDRALLARDYDTWEKTMSSDCVVRLADDPERFKRPQFITMLRSIGSMGKLLRADSHVLSIKPDPKKPNSWIATVSYTSTGLFVDPRTKSTKPSRLTQRQQCVDTWRSDADGVKLTGRIVDRAG